MWRAHKTTIASIRIERRTFQRQWRKRRWLSWKNTSLFKREKEREIEREKETKQHTTHKWINRHFRRCVMFKILDTVNNSKCQKEKINNKKYNKNQVIVLMSKYATEGNISAVHIKSLLSMYIARLWWIPEDRDRKRWLTVEKFVCIEESFLFFRHFSSFFFYISQHTRLIIVFLSFALFSVWFFFFLLLFVCAHVISGNMMKFDDAFLSYSKKKPTHK